MSKTPEPGRIIISVNGGFVERVFSTIPFDIEVEVLDMDCAKQESPEATDAMRARQTEIEKSHNTLFGGAL